MDNVINHLSGLKILYLTEEHYSQPVNDNLFPNNRYEFISPLTFNTLLRWARDSQFFFIEPQIKIADYAGNDVLSRLLRHVASLLKFKFIKSAFDFFYLAINLFKFTQFESSKFWRQVKIIWELIKDKRIKALADELIKSNASWIIMSPNVSSWTRYAMLASALHSRTPISFSKALIEEMEPAAHVCARRRRSGNIKNISEIYGASKIVADYCRIDFSSVRIPGFWMHGWIPAYHNVHPAFIALHKRERTTLRLPWTRDPFDRRDLQLVTRQDQEKFLLENGYQRVKAMGHPLVYLETKPKFSRIKNSLLVVPPHGTGWRDENDPIVQKYVEYIDSLKSQFSYIQLCVTVDDYIRKNWWTAFKKINVDNVVSVDRSDPRALHRLMDILSQFEFVTTNGFGSVIVYAAFAGCKISVAGPFAKLPDGLLKKAHAVIHFPHLLAQQIELCSEAALRLHYPDLFVEPLYAQERKKWAESELGINCQLSRAALHALLQGHFN